MSVTSAEILILIFILGGPLLLGLVFSIFLIIRTQRIRGQQTLDNQESALEILDRRYASGEIDSDEYQLRRNRLTESQDRLSDQ